MESEGVIPSSEAWGRVSKVVRTVEGRPNGEGGIPGRRLPSPAETCWAKLTSKAGTSNDWQWSEVYPYVGSDDKLAWQVIPDGRKGDNSQADDGNKNLAIELVKGSGKADKICLLRRSPLLAKKASPSDPDVWLSRWQIVSPLGPVAVVKCTNDNGHAGTTVKVKLWDGSAVSGDEFDATVIRHTTTGDVFSCLTDGTTYTQFGLPTQRIQYMVLQSMDATGGPQGIDFDWLKGH